MANGPRVRISLDGVAAMVRTLQELPNALQVELVKTTLADAAKPMVDAAIANAPDADPVGRGIVSKLFVTEKLNPSQEKSEAAPRIDEVKLYVGTNQPHAHLNEWGTGPREQASTGRFVGEMPAKPFLRPAFDSTASTVIKRFAEKIKIVIESAARGLAKNAP